MTLAETLKLNTTRGQLILAGTVCVLITIAITVAYYAFLRPRYEVLFSRLRSADAAAIVAELDKQKLDYRLADGGATILVPEERLAKTRLDIMSTSVPLKGTVGFELFNKSDLGLTEFAQQINYQRALQGELARTIMDLSGVEDARIHLALPEHAVFREDAKAPKASVTILTKPDQTLSPATIRGIQRLISAAVPDLEAANVVVLDGSGAVVSSQGDEPGIDPARHRRELEQSFEGAVRQALASSFPGRHLDVAVWALSGSSESLAAADPGASRDFGLRIAITEETAATPADEGAIRAVVIQTVHADPNLGDVITFNVAAPPPKVAPPNAKSVVTAKPTPPASVAVWTGVAIAALAGLGMGLLFVLHRHLSRPRRLTSRQKDEFAARLKAIFEQAEAESAA